MLWPGAVAPIQAPSIDTGSYSNHGLRISLIWYQGEWHVPTPNMDGEIQKPWIPGMAPEWKYTKLTDYLRYVEYLCGLSK